MISIKAPKLSRLQAEFKSAPAKYRRAMQRALSTTKKTTKTDAIKIAQTIYTAGRNKISESLSTSNIDKRKQSFKLIGLKKGISLIDFTHTGTVAKKWRGVPVRVQPLRGKGASTIEDSFIKKGRKSGKLRIMQWQRSGPLPVIALASSSVADMLNRDEVAKRLQDFSTKKMSNELARQIAMIFR